jgi:hypothetical protein
LTSGNAVDAVKSPALEALDICLQKTLMKSLQYLHWLTTHHPDRMRHVGIHHILKKVFQGSLQEVVGSFQSIHGRIWTLRIHKFDRLCEEMISGENLNRKPQVMFNFEFVKPTYFGLHVDDKFRVPKFS